MLDGRSGVARGEVTIYLGDELAHLKGGDAIFFVADAYENRTDSSAILYLVMTYTHEIGG